MTNAEKYKTAEERGRVFDKWCRSGRRCDECILHDSGIELQTCVCAFYWLDLEAEEEKPLPCPFCGGECTVNRDRKVVGCSDCSYSSITGWTMEDVITAHNRVARAVMEAAKCTS